MQTTPLSKTGRRRRLTLLGFIAASLTLFATCIQATINRCIWWECAPRRDFDVYDFSIPSAYYPDGIESNPLTDTEIWLPVQEGISATYLDYGLSIYSVFRFATVEQAAEWYENEAGDMKWSIQASDSELPIILPFAPRYSDEFIVECGIRQAETRCTFDARYQEFTTYFASTIGPNSLSEQQYVAILQFIDDQFGRFLSESSNLGD